MIRVVNNNIIVFLKLVRSGLWEKECRLSPLNNIDFNEVIRLADEQSVTGLVTAGIEHVVDIKVPKEVVLQFIGCSIQLEQRNNSMNTFIANLVKKLRDNGIYLLLVKGQSVAQSYERPNWRSSGDVDFFLSTDNYAKAKDYLIPLATEVEAEDSATKHLGLIIDNWVVELHGSLKSSLSSRINKELESIQTDTFYQGEIRSWFNNDVQIFSLEVVNDIIYTFIHFLGHYFKGGVGLRQICDWCRLLWIYRETICIDKLERRLKSMGVISEWKAFAAMAVLFLGMPKDAMPLYDDRRIWKKKAKHILSYILEVGNFGINRNNSFNNQKYYLRKVKSLWRILEDFRKHVTVFPISSLRFFSSFLRYGLLNVVIRKQ